MFIIDFETRSRCDLKTAGSYLYASDPSTDILCMAVYDTETDYKEIWYPAKEGGISPRIIYGLENADFIAAHNAEFDQGIYECIAVPDYGFPEIPRERWYCTAAQCRVNALPASLDDAAMALGLRNRKDHRGARLIQQLSIPQKDGTFNEDPALMAEMREYCMQDVITTVDVLMAGRRMTQQEHADWLKNCEINETGIRIDTELAQRALEYADAEQADIAKQLDRLTHGVITKHTQGERIKKWLMARLGELHPIVQDMTVYKDGKAKLTLDKNARRNILTKIDEHILDVPDEIQQVIQLLDDGNMSSVAKFKRMLSRISPDTGRVYGAFVFGGASQTLRYASRGVQVHNMKRDCWSAEETDDIKLIMRNGGALSYSGENVMTTLSKLLRPAIVPDPNKVFVVGDWSSIEARVLHWGTDTLEGDQKLQLFEDGVDVYQETADELRLDDRQQGKVVELSAGYQGHANAFQAMARNYGVKVSHEVAGEIVNKWRQANWWVVNFWQELEQAAMDAIRNPEVRYRAGVLEYVYIPELMDGTLLCIMPGNHFLQYPKARLEEVTTPWGEQKYAVTALKAGYKPKADAKEWPRVALYGGLYCENFCQGFSAAILRNALRASPKGWCVMHVHDEIVWEVPKRLADARVDTMATIMNTVPDWADGLPLKAEPVIMTRYGK